MSPILYQLQSEGFADLGRIDADAPINRFVGELAKLLNATPITGTERLTATAPGAKPLNTYGGNYALSEIPLHTDLAHWHRPPRYLLLRCVAGSREVATKIVHHRILESYVSPALLRRAMFSPRRRLEGRMYLLRLMTSELFRWDNLFLTPQNASAREVAALMRVVASELPTEYVFLSEPGRALLIDNWRALHGRDVVPPTSIGRKLDRIYLDSQ